jgi:hypothetical protein
MPFVIKYDDGTYNYGPSGTPMNGHPVTLAEATRYESVEAAEEKAVDLRYPDGSGVEIVPVTETLENSNATPSAKKPSSTSSAEWAEHVRDAYACLRTYNSSIPDEVLAEMRAVLETHGRP